MVPATRTQESLNLVVLYSAVVLSWLAYAVWSKMGQTIFSKHKGPAGNQTNLKGVQYVK